MLRGLALIVNLFCTAFNQQFQADPETEERVNEYLQHEGRQPAALSMADLQPVPSCLDLIVPVAPVAIGQLHVLHLDVAALYRSPFAGPFLEERA